MTTYQTDPRVDGYISSLPAWQQDICVRVRDLVHSADPMVVETIKRTNRPTSRCSATSARCWPPETTSISLSTTPSRPTLKASSIKGKGI